MAGIKATELAADLRYAGLGPRLTHAEARDLAAAVTFTTVSPDGCVRVLMDANGRLVALDLRFGGHRDRSSTVVAAAVEEALNRASRTARSAMTSVLSRK